LSVSGRVSCNVGRRSVNRRSSFAYLILGGWCLVGVLARTALLAFASPEWYASPEGIGTRRLLLYIQADGIVILAVWAMIRLRRDNQSNR
jgi:hypothetical protein